jgi:1-acyl-sn-glycerol-3-phosphate acyltransferase
MPCLFLPNHSSQFDIFATAAGLPFHFGYLAKEELFTVPVFGEAMLRMRNLPIIREDKRKAFMTIKKAIENVKDGTNMVIYPEGTRSTTGELLPFKPGAFHIAVGTGRPVVPVAITGAYRVQPSEDIGPRRGTIRMEILDPIETNQFGRRDKEKLQDLVYRRIKDALDKAKAEERANGPG